MCYLGSTNTVKISDFGMSREEEEYIVSDGMKQIPIKWTAPEALNFGKFIANYKQNILCLWSSAINYYKFINKFFDIGANVMFLERPVRYKL